MQKHFMLQAIQLSEEMMIKGQGGPFGALIVKDNQVIGLGHNKVTSSNDPTAHAEIVAIRDACKNIGNFDLSGSQIFVNCEPCPMCLAAIYWARINTIYFAADRHDAAKIGFDDALIYQEIALPADKRSLKMVQMMRKEALPVFKQWLNKLDKVEY